MAFEGVVRAEGKRREKRVSHDSPRRAGPNPLSLETAHGIRVDPIEGDVVAN